MNSLPEGQVSFGSVSLTMLSDNLCILPIPFRFAGDSGESLPSPYLWAFFPFRSPFRPGDSQETGRGDNLLCFYDMKIPIAHR